MDRSKSIVLAIACLLLTAGSSLAQSRQAGSPELKSGELAPGEYSTLINKVFAPITSKLKLTNEQQLQIVAIITETEVRADPWAQSLKLIEQQLSQIALDEPLNEAQLDELSDREAALLSDLIVMRVRAKWNIYRLLTPEQRTLVEREFRLQNQLDTRLGTTGN